MTSTPAIPTALFHKDHPQRDAAEMIMICTFVCFFLHLLALVMGINPKNNTPNDQKKLGFFFKIHTPGFVPDHEKNEKTMPVTDGDDKAVGDESDSPKSYPFWPRIAENQKESFPLALIIFWGSLIMGSDNDQTKFLVMCYMILRVVFIICYRLDLTPWRSIVWFLSIVCIVSVGRMGLMEALD